MIKTGVSLRCFLHRIGDMSRDKFNLLYTAVIPVPLFFEC